MVKDRPTILSKLLLLHFLKQDIPALSWEFFVNRFETLSLEAQLHLDCNKEFPFPTSKQNKELALKVSSFLGAWRPQGKAWEAEELDDDLSLHK